MHLSIYPNSAALFKLLQLFILDQWFLPQSTPRMVGWPPQSLAPKPALCLSRKGHLGFAPHQLANRSDHSNFDSRCPLLAVPQAHVPTQFAHCYSEPDWPARFRVTAILHSSATVSTQASFSRPAMGGQPFKMHVRQWSAYS